MDERAEHRGHAELWPEVNPDALPVVGIGASAGGLDAFMRLFREVPPDTGFAFVLIQHLDASHPSSLGEIIARATPMPTREAEDGMQVAPNQVFVIPPNKALTILGRTLVLRPREGSPHLPIDHFLQSLAQSCGSRAVGVILSGTGSDGALGLKAIREAGGVTLVQEPATAEFAGMPAVAALAGPADLLLTPEAIGLELGRVGRHSHFAAGSGEDPASGPLPGDDVGGLMAVRDLMHRETGIDFALYRETTVQRRVLRRLALRGVEHMAEYLQLLAGDPGERDALQRDLLIGVTSFFRDPEAFEALKARVFPALLSHRSAGARLRIWVPGCASGEEAYSILIALQEFQRDRGSEVAVQLFATDLNGLAIVKARTGSYPDSITANVSGERLSQFFTKVEGGYQVIKSLRQSCVFSRHNLLDDPAFSKIDFISCRNVLIYLDAVQKQIIPLFHYALEDHGFLLLGKSETARFPELFTPLEPRLRLYSKKAVKRRSQGVPVPAAMRRESGPASTQLHVPQQTPLRGAVDVSREADRLLLSRFSPPGLLVDKNLEVIEIRGRPASFLSLTTGKVSFHLLKFIPDTGLFLEIERLIQEAAASGVPARRDQLTCELGDRFGEVNIDVTPLGSAENRAYLVLFETGEQALSSAGRAPVHSPASAVVSAMHDRYVLQLKQQLEAARRRLEALVEEHEVSDQENQQVAEEALSANEELQSLTEELETAKEELQSTNEELISVNRDLESKNVSLVVARDFARAIVETVLVPLLVVDADLTVRHVNASFSRMSQVPPGDIEGRSLYLACDGAWDNARLRPLLEATLAEGKPFDSLETEVNLPGIGPRALVFSGRRLDQSEGALLTIMDVTKLRAAEQTLRSNEDERRDAEKLEMVGRLAGGIAHDFNNLLTVVIGDCTLLADALDGEHPGLELVREIRSAAEKAAALTEQLLVFSRRKVLQPKVFDLEALIVEFVALLGRLLGEQIRVVVQCAEQLWHVKADPVEIGRLLMNLTLNARDAMPGGGTLTIQASNALLEDAEATRHGVPEGKYVRLVIRDTGVGMDEATRAHLFEPFFTTKVQTGTGLGLATVFGIVQQSGGAVSCDSQKDRGTAFTVLLPSGRASRSSFPPGERSRSAIPVGRSEVVLLVEDEDSVRTVIRRALVRAGYVVIAAPSGEEGLALIQDPDQVIDVLVTDLVMPGLGGRELAEQAASLRPAMRVLLISGHTEDVAIKHGVARGAAYLQKPFSPRQLAEKVRAVLDAAPGTTAPPSSREG